MKLTEVKLHHLFNRIDEPPIKRFDNPWKACLKEPGTSHFNFHDLPHTLASNLLVSGESLKEIKKMMGNKDILMTNRYSHLIIAHPLQQ